MKIKTFEFNPFGEHTYVVWDSDTRDAMVIDPGMSNERERLEFDRFIADEHLHLTHMVNTHLHLDHVWGNDHVATKYGLVTEANEADAPLGARRREQARMFGMDGAPLPPIEVAVNLRQGDHIKVGELDFTVLQVPGHSPGGIALYAPAEGVLFSGDSLFEGSIGRTDLTGGDYSTLIRAITERLLSLPPSTVVYPGHGAPTTIARELSDNPYL